MSGDFSLLLSPLDIGPRRVRNRVLVSAHQPTLAENGLPGAAYIAYQRARARGGAGLQITGATPVHDTGTFGKRGSALVNLDDSIVPGYRRLAEAVQGEGGRILAQLAHTGATVASHEPGLPLWAPSPVASDLVRETPHEMTAAEIAEVVKAFGAAAARVRAGGLDGIEILAAYGLLIAAFLSPHANRRNDAYGGSLENRLRFCLEVIDAVREGAGPDLVVGIRIPGDELLADGLDLQQASEIARILEATGKLDYFNVIAGNNLDRIQRAAHWPPTPSPHGLFVHLAAGIKRAVSLPVFTVGRVVDPLQAERILRDGHADMVGMTRAHIADPDLVAKLRDGRAGDIRPCVGANVCIRNSMEGRAVGCIHNPEAGREALWGAAEPAAGRRSVAVIGGGPAGLEAARVAAARGHRVELFEREAALGGQLRLWSRVAGMGELARILEWQKDQLRKLQVRVRLGEEMTAGRLRALDAEVVILATGAVAREAAVPGAETASMTVATPQAVIAGAIAAAGHAVVWDQAGGRIGLSAAEHLAGTAPRLTVVTPAFAVGEDVHVIVRIPLYRRLLEAGVAFLANSAVDRLEDADVVVRNLYSGTESRITGVSLLVAACGRAVVDELAEALGREGREVHRIGDCLAPRDATRAFAEGALAARRIR